MNKIPLTPNGKSKVEQELKNSKTIERPRIIDSIAEARAHGDLSENADSCVANVKGFFPSFVCSALFSHNVLASFSLSRTMKSSPALAAPFIPKISTGVEGNASLIFSSSV